MKTIRICITMALGVVLCLHRPVEAETPAAIKLDGEHVSEGYQLIAGDGFRTVVHDDWLYCFAVEERDTDDLTEPYIVRFGLKDRTCETICKLTAGQPIQVSVHDGKLVAQVVKQKRGGKQNWLVVVDLATKTIQRQWQMKNLKHGAARFLDENRLYVAGVFISTEKKSLARHGVDVVRWSDGEVLTSVRNFFPGAPVLHDGQLYFGSHYPGSLTHVDLKQGEVVRKRMTSSWIIDLVRLGDTLYANYEPGGDMGAYDPKTLAGKKLPQALLDGGKQCEHLFVDSARGEICVVDKNSRVRCFNADGDLTRQSEFTPPGKNSNWVGLWNGRLIRVNGKEVLLYAVPANDDSKNRDSD